MTFMWKTAKFALLPATLLFGTILSAQTTAPLILQFSNLRPDAETVPAYVMFGGGGTLTGVNIANNAAIVKGVSYKLSDLSAGVSLTEYISGRVFFSVGAPLTSPSQANGYSPNFANPSLPDFTTRWDKVEMDLGHAETGLAGGANLSAQDFFSLPLRIDSDGGRSTPAKLAWRETTANVMTALSALSNYSVSTLQNVSGAIVLGDNGVSIPHIAIGKVVRIISPASVAPLPQGRTVYASLAGYIGYLQTGNRTSPGQPIPTLIQGHNGIFPNTNSFQNYYLTGTILNAPTSKNGFALASGDLLLDGVVNNGSSDIPTSIVVTKTTMTDYVLYGANPASLLIQGTNDNGIVPKVIADYFSAINFGLAGSTVDNPAMPGTAIGDSPSWTWYGNKPNGGNLPRLPVMDAFTYAQPTNPDRYMQYAAYLVGVSDAYGFAYNDRLQSPLASYTDGARVTISILPDGPVLTASEPVQVTLHSVAAESGGFLLARGSVAVVEGNLPVSSKVVAPGSNVPLPFSLGGLSARFGNNFATPLFQAEPRIALIQVPWELPEKTTTFQVQGQGQMSQPQEVEIRNYVPSIFTSNGAGVIVDASGQLADPSHPAAPGSVVVVYCTGLGPVQNRPPTGAPSPFSPLATTVEQPLLFIDGKPAVVVYSGLTPGQVGLYQINAILPEGGRTGSAVPVQISIGGAVSNSATLAIQKANK